MDSSGLEFGRVHLGYIGALDSMVMRKLEALPYPMYDELPAAFEVGTR